jgi:cytochrome oxidase assembly protein ShyY1
LQNSDQPVVPETAPTFFQVARRPKWIGALVISLMVAAVFAAFGQWQLERTFTQEQPADVLYNIESVAVKIDTKNIYIIANRLNEGSQGYWLVGNTIDQQNKSLTVAFGWSADLAEIQGERQALIDSDLGKVETKLEGVFIPSEAPRPQQNELPYVFDSLSLAQLINIYSPESPIESQPEILALNGSSQASAWPPLQAIDVTYEAVQRINWLSAFYFLEWVLFAGFALFLWWRLVRDEQILLAGEKVN